MALLGTFIAMYFCGYSLDNLSLLALTLSVGFVSTMHRDARKHCALHRAGHAGARGGVQGLGARSAFTILSMTLSLVAVFIPAHVHGRILGRLLHEFAVTIMASIIVWAWCRSRSRRMLCSRFLKPHHSGETGAAWPVLSGHGGSLRGHALVLRADPAGQFAAQARHDRHRGVMACSPS